MTEARRYNAALGGPLIGKTSYDDGGRLTTETEKDGSGTALVSYVNAYDAADGIVTETRNSVARNYGYDSTSQVTSDSGTGASFAYDLNGNRTMSGYSTGAANRLSTDGTWNYSYDSEGNLIAKTNISSGHVWDYLYDLRNQMTEAQELTSAGGSVLQTIDYAYDVYGNMVKRDFANGFLSTHQKFAYDITDVSPGFTTSVHALWAELNGSGSLITRYLDVGSNAIARSDSSNAYWLLADRIGSVREVTDGSGSIVSAISYTTFGGLLSETNSALSGNVLFTGGMFDRLVGLYDMRFRWYDPQSGQWTTEDQTDFKAGDANLRRYVGNGAMNGVDRNGLQERYYYDPRDPRANKNATGKGQYERFPQPTPAPIEEPKKSPKKNEAECTERIYLLFEDGNGAIGHGHAAVLISTDFENDKWKLYSLYPKSGIEAGTFTDVDARLETPTYNSLSAAIKATSNFTDFAKWKITPAQKKQALAAAAKWEGQKYNLIGSNCLDLAGDVLKAAGINVPIKTCADAPSSGTSVPTSLAPKLTREFTSKIASPKATWNGISTADPDYGPFFWESGKKFANATDHK